MLRKLIWALLVIIVAWVWSSSVLSSCDSGITKAKVNQLGKKTDEVFQYDEDADDEEYIAQDDSDDLDEEDIIKNRDKSSVAAAKDKLLGKGAEVKEAAAIGTKKISDKVKDVVEKSGNKIKSTKNKVTDKVKSPKRDVPISTTASSQGDFLVVAGSFSNEIYADEFVKKLQGMGYKNTEKIVFDFSKYFSVIAGRYSTEKDAENRELELKKKGVEAYTHQVRSKFFDDE